jgi:hypothetical protein
LRHRHPAGKWIKSDPNNPQKWIKNDPNIMMKKMKNYGKNQKRNFFSEMDPKNDEKLWQTSTETTETWGKEIRMGKASSPSQTFSIESHTFPHLSVIKLEPLGLVARRVFTVIIISTTLPKVAFSIPAS